MQQKKSALQSGLFEKTMQKKLSENALSLMDLLLNSPDNMETAFKDIYDRSPEALFIPIDDPRTLINKARTSPARYALYSNHTRAISLIESLLLSNEKAKDRFKLKKNAVTPHPTYLLAQATFQANYAKITKLASSNPESIVTRVWCGQNQMLIMPFTETVDGTHLEPQYTFRKTENQSPIELACYSYDSFAIQIYISAIKNHAPHLLDELISQIKGQVEHYDIEPLLQTYRSYVEFVRHVVIQDENTETQTDESESDTIELELVRMNKLQKNLPRHFLLEICRPYKMPASIDGIDVISYTYHTWKESYDFSYKKNTPPPLQFISVNPSDIGYFNAAKLIDFLGYPSLNAQIVRGDLEPGAQFVSYLYQGVIDEDCKIFSKLYQTRKVELNEMVHSLELIANARSSSSI